MPKLREIKSESWIFTEMTWKWFEIRAVETEEDEEEESEQDEDEDGSSLLSGLSDSSTHSLAGSDLEEDDDEEDEFTSSVYFATISVENVIFSIVLIIRLLVFKQS